MKKKILLVSIITIVLCISVIAGSTFALFTTKTEVNIVVQAGELGVEAEVKTDSVKVKSLGQTDYVEVAGNKFPNGGYAYFDDQDAGKLKIENMTPGDAISFDIFVENTGEIGIAYAVDWVSKCLIKGETTYKDSDAIKISVTVPTEDPNVTKTFIEPTRYFVLGDGTSDGKTTVTVTVEFANDNNHANNDNLQGAKWDIQFAVNAVQANGINADGTLKTTP